VAHATPTTNIQAFPRDIKHVWIADPGYSLIWGDWKAIESVLTAYFAQDRQRLEIVLSGGDLYAYAASSLYGCAPTRAAAKALRVDFGGQLRSARDAAKTFDLARGYWMGPRTFAEKHGLAQKEASRLIQLHDSKWPAIVRYREATAWRALKDRYLQTPFGWRRYFWTPFSGKRIEEWGDAREAVSHRPQSTAASIFKRALACLPPERVWACRHDEIVLHVPDSEVQHWAQELQKAMEQSWPQLSAMPDLYPHGFWCSAEIAVGKQWGVVTNAVSQV